MKQKQSSINNPVRGIFIIYTLWLQEIKGKVYGKATLIKTDTSKYSLFNYEFNYTLIITNYSIHPARF